MEAESAPQPSATDGSRDVALTIPARPDYLVLARLALSAVCRLTPLRAEEIADLKLAITEAANDFVDEGEHAEDADEGRLSFSFKLLDDRLLLELDGPMGAVDEVERELGRAIIDATVDESQFGDGRTLLVKYLTDTPE